MTSENGPRDTARKGVSITDDRMGINSLQRLGSGFQQQHPGIYGRGPSSPWRCWLLQVQDNLPSLVSQGLLRLSPFDDFIRCFSCGCQPRQRVPHLCCQFVGNVDHFCSAVLPVVLNLDQPRYIAFDAENVDRPATTGDGLELIAIERPIVVLAGMTTVAEAETQRPLRNCGHALDSALGMNRSMKRSDWPSSSSRASRGSTSPISTAWEMSTPLSSRRSAK